MSRTPGNDAAKELNKMISQGQIDYDAVANSLLVTIANELGAIRDALDSLAGVKDDLA